MKILYVTPRLPFPPYKGDKLRTFHFIRELSKHHTVDLLSFIESKDELQYVDEMKKYCRNVETVMLPKWWSLIKMLTGLLSLVPFQVLYYSSLRMHFRLQKMLKTKHYDVVHVVLVRMMEYAAECKDVPVVIDHIDALSLNMKRRMQQTGNIFKKAILWWESKKLTIYERKCEKLQTYGVITSPVDATSLNHRWSKVISNGVDTDAFCPQNLDKKFDAIFTGNMSYFPNVDAMKFYDKKVLPHLVKYRPKHECYIAGIDPSKEIRALNRNPHFMVTGFVEDLAGYLNQAKVFVAPLQSGTGIQNKVLEAMSCGLPVVSTSFGNAGIRAKDGHEMIIADDGETFAAKVHELLDDPIRQKQLGENARELVKRKYSWTANSRKLLASYKQAIHLHRIEVIEKKTGRVPIEALHLGERDVLDESARAHGRESRWGRAINIFAACLIGIFAAPMLLGGALAILLTMGRPVFFIQQRVGKNGKSFKLYKLRTMVRNAEKHGAMFAGKNDSRVTPLGRFLRKTRMDELPQLWNVLRGDMRLVGPRPERPEFVRDFNFNLPLYDRRHAVRPGLTGWAQVKFSYAENRHDTYKKLQYDLYYIKNKSLLFDLGILVRTVGVVLTGKGAR